MSLGGYKFVGYHFSLPADYGSTVDAQVIAQCLRLHKMKLKAFMESCAASGANWGFSETSGEESFESYGNVIYKLDAGGFNYASFFRYGSDDAYYCILTCSNCSSDGSGGTFNLSPAIYTYYISSTRYMCAGSNNFDSIGLSPITPSNLFSTNSAALHGRLTLFNNNSGTVNSGNSAFIYFPKTVESRYFGYATKNKNIISISSSDLQSFAAKVNGIGSLSLSSPNDTNNMFSVCNDVTGETTTAATYSIGSGNVQVSNRSGYPYDRDAITSGTGRNAYCMILVPKKATMVAPTNSISYESANITCAFVRTTADYILNSDGITSKGSVDIDLLSVNWIYGGNGIVPGNTYANGNYLCIYKKRSTASSGDSYSGALYCGWDSSNPDITAPTSWPEWT